MEVLEKGIITFKHDIKNGDIQFEIPVSEVQSYIEDGYLIILKNVFDEEKLLSLRNSIQEWALDIPEHPITQTASLPNINFHRCDNVFDSKYINRLFHQYGFGDLSSLPLTLKNNIEQVAEPLQSLQNQIAKTLFRHDMPEYRIKCFKHNSGGGFFQQHIHPYLPQKVAYFLSMSRYGKDYRDGHVNFKTPYGDQKLNKLFDIGNLILFKYNLPHGVTPIDSNEKLDWHSDKGLWILSGEHINNFNITIPSSS